MAKKITIPVLSDEYANAQLGDRRLNTRAGIIADAAGRLPEASLPVQAGSDVQLEGTYRFFNNPRVDPEAVLDGHAGCTVERAAKAGLVLVVHDTTTMSFGGEKMRAGLGPVTGAASQGFFMHASICETLDGQPLGTLAVYSWSRTAKRKGRRSQGDSRYAPDRESLRWADAVHATAEKLHGKAEAIHVMDREGDCIELFADLMEHGYRFVIRLSHDRYLKPNNSAVWGTGLFESLQTAPLVLEREVELSRRSAKKGLPNELKKFPPREKRLATLEVRAQQLTIYPGKGSAAHLPEHLTLNFVDVREVNCPEDMEPVRWRLVTTESIETAEDVALVVDIYRRRWLVEEYFKALKTGCNFEKLQLETGAGLMVALAIYVSVAWRLLLIRWMERNMPEAPASAVVTPTQLKVLKAVRARARKPLPPNPTVRDIFDAIAQLGAHLKRNGPPGWRVLGRGFDKLLMLELGWLAAQDE